MKIVSGDNSQLSKYYSVYTFPNFTGDQEKGSVLISYFLSQVNSVKWINLHVTCKLHFAATRDVINHALLYLLCNCYIDCNTLCLDSDKGNKYTHKMRKWYNFQANVYRVCTEASWQLAGYYECSYICSCKAKCHHRVRNTK